MKPVVILTIAGTALMASFFGWAFYAAGQMPGSWFGEGATRIVIIAGIIVTGLLTGVLMWLAFYSSRKGFDEPPRFHDINGDR